MERLYHVAFLVPVLIGLLAPTVAFFQAQENHGYVAGADEDIDAAVTSAESALPLTTLVTIPAFVGLALFLRSARSRVRPALLWIGSLLGTGLMTAIVMTGHIGMYDLLYTRGRMHSTSGVGILFTAIYCVLVAALIVVLTVWAGRAVQQKRSS